MNINVGREQRKSQYQTFFTQIEFVWLKNTIAAYISFYLDHLAVEDSPRSISTNKMHARQDTKMCSIYIIKVQTTIDLIYSFIHIYLFMIRAHIKHIELDHRLRRRWRRLWTNNVEHLEWRSEFHMLKQQM